MNLREKMPTVTAWIDELRDAFGREEIDGVIRAGIRGIPGFYARENGIEVGTPSPPARVEVSVAQMCLARAAEESKR